jgi:thiamine-monophosphate kinase
VATEFELIARYFTPPVVPGGIVRTGVGDDCALLDIGDRTLAVTTDMLIEGRHFFATVDPQALGHKALAVNLSDLAAAGATPQCFFLALALPRADEAWLAAFRTGLMALADRQGCVLAGGDTTRAALPTQAPVGSPADGPITICITAIGDVPRDQLRSRAGAQPADDIWVSGTLGDAALALETALGRRTALAAADLAFCKDRLEQPTPRVELGIALRSVATAAIDVSDGLLGDLGHVLERSAVGATIDFDAVPRSPALRTQSRELQLQCALAGGDDYELLFTVPPTRREAVQALAQTNNLAVTRIGRIESESGLRVCDAVGNALTLLFRSFDHFAAQ